MDRKTHVNDKGYLVYDDTNKLVHREIAYKHIFLPNRQRYHLNFGDYVVHHKDGNKQNNDVSNLMIVVEEEHYARHGRDLCVTNETPRSTRPFRDTALID